MQSSSPRGVSVAQKCIMIFPIVTFLAWMHSHLLTLNQVVNISNCEF